MYTFKKENNPLYSNGPVKTLQHIVQRELTSCTIFLTLEGFIVMPLYYIQKGFEEA